VIPGLVLPAETLHLAEALQEETAKIHAAVREAQEAQARLEAALKPHTVSEVPATRDVRRLARELESLLRWTESIDDDGRHIAVELGAKRPKGRNGTNDPL